MVQDIGKDKCKVNELLRIKFICFKNVTVNRMMNGDSTAKY